MGGEGFARPSRNLQLDLIDDFLGHFILAPVRGRR